MESGPSVEGNAKELGNDLSKRAQKRLLKKEKRESLREVWKKIRREKKKKRNKASTISNPIKDCGPVGRIIFDCCYNDLMTEKELSSLCGQLSRSYALNRRVDNPFIIEVYGFNGVLSEILKKQHTDFSKWKNILFFAQSLSNVDTSMLYLSSDSTTVLETVDRSVTHIIGGLVDRNRHKGVALKRAEDLGIPTKRLPIKENVKLTCSAALTAVNVFEILLKYKDSESWDALLAGTIPRRKQKPDSHE